METGRVVHRLQPYPGEDVMGFLTRVATRNHLKGRSEILLRLNGSPNGIATVADLPKLADYCRLSSQEIAMLSGVIRRGPCGETQTYVCGEWVEKHAFVAPRQAKICPRCLREGGFVRGIWAITLYTVCPTHEASLITRCPECRRALKWDRKNIARCGCGYDLTLAGGKDVKGAPLQFAYVVELRLGERNFPNRLKLDLGIVDLLSGLSLNGILKVMWFLGHCVGDMQNCRQAHGHAQPDPDTANRIVERAFHLASEWPRNLHAELTRLASRQAADSSASLLDRLLGPAQYYLRHELYDSEFEAIAGVYDRLIGGIWKHAGRRCSSLAEGRQLSLCLE